MMTGSEKIDREIGRDVFFSCLFILFFQVLNIGVYETFGSMTFSSGLHNIPGARQRLIRLPYHIAKYYCAVKYILICLSGLRNIFKGRIHNNLFYSQLTNLVYKLECFTWRYFLFCSNAT